MQNTTDTLLGESMNPPPLSQDLPPLYAKCLSCPDFGPACRGVDITSLGGPAEKRAYHKAIRKAFGFYVKDIYAIVKDILGKTTVDEYFGPGTGDYKWLTVTTIHNALLQLVAQKKGMPLCEHSCSSSSSEVRNQLAAADLNIAAANLSLATAQAECEDLRRRLADADGVHLAQLTEIQASKNNEIEWFKKGILFWRRFAITTVMVLLVALLLLGVCIVHLI